MNQEIILENLTKLRTKLSSIDGEILPYLTKAEETLNIPYEQLVAGVGALVILSTMYAMGIHGLVTLGIFTYPFCMTIVSMSSKVSSISSSSSASIKSSEWLVYWMLFGVNASMETHFMGVLNFIPGYVFLKLAFYLSCMAPSLGLLSIIMTKMTDMIPMDVELDTTKATTTKEIPEVQTHDLIEARILSGALPSPPVSPNRRGLNGASKFNRRASL